MSSNKSARVALERLYGKECFIEKLGLRRFDKPRKYTSRGQKKKMKQLTYHHIREKCHGGEATVENGALLSNENHVWFHKQSPERQEKMNTIFQEYKQLVDECRIVLVEDIEVPFKICPAEIYIEDREKEKYDRVKKKQEDKKIIKEWEEER